MTKALFLCPNLQAGGAERHWAILLPRLVVRGLNVEVFTLDGEGPFFDELKGAGVPIRCLRVTGGRIPSYIAAAWRLDRMRPDVLVSRGTSAEGLAALSARSHRLPWAVNWHHPPGLAITPRRRAILRWAIPRADAILAVSESQRRELVALGARSASVAVIQNGSDFRPSDSRRDDIRAALGLAASDFVALLVGRLESQKRIDLFIEALSQVRGQGVSIVGLVAGQGPDLPALVAQVQGRGVDVRFLGRREDMPDVFAMADVLCLTSDVEASPYVLIEAMACGLPVVATRVGGVPEMVVHNYTGILVDPRDISGLSDGLRRLARSISERKRMGNNASIRYRTHFSADVMADAYAEALLRIAGR
jgi:glycosyltransferase involved in cell wall biosynthesis